MRFARAALLTSTAIAWLVPSLLAMWLDVERFVHPWLNAPPAGDYERDPGFQRMFFVVRYGWILALVLVIVLVVQAGLLRRIKERRPEGERGAG